MSSMFPKPTRPDFPKFSIRRLRPMWIGLAIIVLGILALGCRIGLSIYRQQGNKLEQSVRPPTEADRDRIATHVSAVSAMLRSRYGDVQLTHSEDDLRLLQTLHDDGVLQSGHEDELTSVGIVFGEVLAARTPLRWATVEWDGERMLALQYPNTTVIVFPGAMIAKRVDRRERVVFASLFDSVATQVEQLKDDPEYRR
jgi:hypothetical protein